MWQTSSETVRGSLMATVMEMQQWWQLQVLWRGHVCGMDVVRKCRARVLCAR